MGDQSQKYVLTMATEATPDLGYHVLGSEQILALDHLDYVFIKSFDSNSITCPKLKVPKKPKYINIVKMESF